MENDIKNEQLKPYFGKMSIWAYSIGTSIGWGWLVVTCNTYLAQAGVMGTVFGLVLGMLVTFVITQNLQYMICRNQNAGGIYKFTQKACGHDFGFLAAWFLLLTYISILWANITSVPAFYAVYKDAQKNNIRLERATGMTGSTIAVGISDFIKGRDKSVLEVFSRADSMMYEKKKEMKSV